MFWFWSAKCAPDGKLKLWKIVVYHRKLFSTASYDFDLRKKRTEKYMCTLRKAQWLVRHTVCHCFFQPEKNITVNLHMRQTLEKSLKKFCTFEQSQCRIQNSIVCSHPEQDCCSCSHIEWPAKNQTWHKCDLIKKATFYLNIPVPWCSSCPNSSRTQEKV